MQALDSRLSSTSPILSLSALTKAPRIPETSAVKVWALPSVWGRMMASASLTMDTRLQRRSLSATLPLSILAMSST